MRNNRAYVGLIILGAVTAIGGILMKFSGNPSLRAPGNTLGWAGIAVLLIARLLFGRRKPQPPSPKA